MSAVNFNELFGSFSAADALAATETKKTSGFSNGELYKPSIKDDKCKDMNYRSLVRFIPFYHEGKWRTTLSRWECWLKDVNGENGIFVVSPKTAGKNCPMRNLSYKLYTSDNAIDKANSKKINVYQQYYALVEVVKDVQHPEYDGKVFIYQFGQKINDKLEACRFIDKTAPIHFGDGQTLTQDDPETQKAFLDWLDKDAPKIKNYLWKEWDAETTEKVNSILATYKSGYVAPRTTTAVAKETVKNVPETPVSTPVIETTMKEEPVQETTISEDDDAWINSVLNS